MNIGLSQRVLYHKGRAYDSLEHGWYHFLKGHTLYPLPNRLDQDFEQLAFDLDCLIITGGDDSSIRRATEFKIASAMMKELKPILGVCHGAFLLTDSLGGEIIQCEGHMDTEHMINYNGEYIMVNSHHGQTIIKPHSTATVIATDELGACEAWIDKNMAGIVWHPERMKTPFVPKEILNIINLF
jgi:gamma-glutamyl-gamma-aminobutyrate hydrolase PuuD